MRQGGRSVFPALSVVGAGVFHPCSVSTWEGVTRLDLSAFCDGITAQGSAPGPQDTDLRLHVALWLHTAL